MVDTFRTFAYSDKSSKANPNGRRFQEIIKEKCTVPGKTHFVEYILDYCALTV
jgi:hypothetical protein